MPRTKKKSRSSQKSSQPKVKSEVKYLIIWILIIVKITVIVLSLFSQAGIVGEWIEYALSRLFGVARYSVPILILSTMAIRHMSQGGMRVLRFICLYLFFWMSLALIHFMNFSNSEGAIAGASAGQGGGWVGQSLYWVGMQLFGYFGGILVILSLWAITIIVGLNNSFKLERIGAGFRYLVELFQSDSSEDEVQSSTVAVPKTKSEVDARMKDSEPQERLFNDSLGETSAPQPASAAPTESKEVTSHKTPDWMKEENFALPSLDLLEPGDAHDTPKSGDLKKNAKIIQNTLQTFGIEVDMGSVDVGPTVTRYMLRPSNGVKLSRITALQNDLALALAAQAIRIEAPIPGMSYVGIEIPNEKRATVKLRDILDSKVYQSDTSHLPMALGRDVMNKVIIFPLEKMPHLLIAGATGAGKSMGLNAMILSMLYKNPPSRLKFIFIDPKRVELSTYNGIPHLLVPAIVQPDKAMNALNWCVTEMERRYEMLARYGSRNIFTFNEKIVKESLTDDSGEVIEIMPFIVVVIDELADLMTTHKKEVEGAIVRIAQMARAVGIHLVLATQRPSTDVITGLIKANLPSRVSFQVASQIDSRTVLDMMGAEKLLGRGDMLFIGGDLAKPQRVQGPFVPENEVKAVVDWLKNQKKEEYEYNDSIVAADAPKSFYQSGSESGGDSDDQLFDSAKELVLQSGKGSASLLQRRLKIGYSRAARLLDDLEEAGIVGPAEGSKPREVYGDGHMNDDE